MRYFKKIVSFLMAAVTVSGSAMNCIGATAEAAEQQKASASTAIATGTNAVGSVLAPSLNEELEKLQNAEGCNIFSTHSYGKSATVYFSTNKDCKLVVGVYTDLYTDGVEKMVASSVTDVSAEQKQTDVTFNIDQMPASYILKAYLIDEDGSMLTAEYVDETNTLDLKELMAPGSDISHYQQQGYLVLNLDENSSTNFVVYNKNVKVLQTSGSNNKLTSKDEKNGVYKIKNLKATLRADDLVALEGDKAIASDKYNVTLFRVKSVSTSGNITTIKTDTSLDPEETFDFIKIQVHTDEMQTPPQQPSQPAPGAQTNQTTPADTSSTYTNRFELNITKESEGISILGGSLSGKLSGNIGGTAKYSADLNYFKSSKHESSSFGFNAELDATFGINGSATLRYPIPNLSIGTPGTLSGVGVDIQCGLSINVELYGTANGKMNVYMSYDKDGCDTKKELKGDVDGNLFIGLSADLKAKMNNVFIHDKGISLSGSLGIVADPNFVENHPICSCCHDIDLSMRFSLSANVQLYKLFNLKAYYAATSPIAHIYHSDVLGYGLGICPNRGLSDAEDGSNSNCLRYLPDYFRNPDGTVEHVEYKVELLPGANPKTVVIPATHRSPYKSDDFGVCPVTSIEVGGFRSATNLESIHLPDTIKVIGHEAFKGCTNLKYINLPDGLTWIQGSAFSGCSKLEAISIPDGITVIEGGTFCGCTCLKNVNLPSTITSINSEAFRYCASLDHFTATGSIQTIQRGAFWNTGISSFTLRSNNYFDTINICDYLNFSSKLRRVVIDAPVKELQSVPGDVELVINYPDDLETVNNKPYHQSVSIDTNIPASSPEPTKTVTFTNLKPNSLYNFYDILGGKTITTENLLYLSQNMTDEKGKLTVEYRPRINDASSCQFVHCCIDQDGIAPLNQTVQLRARVYNQTATYQWQYKNGNSWANTNLTGNKTASVSVPVTEARDGYQYRCKINLANGLSIISAPAMIKVQPTITKQPASATLEIGKTAKFSVTATGNKLTYQWQYNSGKGWYNSGMSGNKTAAMTVPVIAARDGYLYRCVITAANGENVISDEASLKVKAAITKQPESVTKLIDETATFSVTATGKDLTYQWEIYGENGWKSSNASGNKTASISVPVTAARNGYKYRCIVKSSNGTTVTSIAVTLTVQAKITYNANGGTGSAVVQKHTSGTAVILKPADTFTRTGYTFVGWNTKADGSGNTYAAGQEVTWKNNVTLYAQWKPQERTITYKANGGNGSDVVQKHGYAEAVNLKPGSTFTRSGYTFVGWNSKADGTGNSYVAGQKVAWKNNVTLYAQWKK